MSRGDGPGGLTPVKGVPRGSWGGRAGWGVGTGEVMASAGRGDRLLGGPGKFPRLQEGHGRREASCEPPFPL